MFMINMALPCNFFTIPNIKILSCNKSVHIFLIKTTFFSPSRSLESIYSDKQVHAVINSTFLHKMAIYINYGVGTTSIIEKNAYIYIYIYIYA